MSKTKVVALTGSIGSGKSTVSKVLQDAGVPCIDADRLSREASGRGTLGYQQLVAELGSKILLPNGDIDRDRLRDLVFADAEIRKKVETILHPEIQERYLKEIKKHFDRGTRLVVYEASLVLEAKREKQFDGILVVVAPEKEIPNRVHARNPKIPKKQVEEILAAQLSQEEKRKRATWVIENDSTFDELKGKTLSWLNSLKF